MNYEQYREFTDVFEQDVKRIYNNALALHKPDTGVYYPVEELDMTNGDFRPFYTQELKYLGLRFYDNNTLYRV
jgi:hypothetical protein